MMDSLSWNLSRTVLPKEFILFHRQCWDMYHLLLCLLTSQLGAELYAVTAYLRPVPLPPDALYRDILLQKPEGRTTEAISCVDLLRWGGRHLAGSSLSLTEGRDPWALHKIFIWLENSMCYMCLFPDYLLIGILCSPVTALCLAGSWWNSPLPNLPRANFSMSAQV